MTLYAFLVSAFFAILWREDRRERWKLFGILMAALVRRRARRGVADVPVSALTRGPAAAVLISVP